MNTAQALTNAARDLLLAHPQLDVSRAYALALERDPALAARHHHGDAGQAAPPAQPVPAAPELVDPGELLMQHAAANGISFAEAAKAHPALGAAYHHGQMVARPKSPLAPVEQVMVFRAALPKERIGADGTLRAVQIFRVGEWNGVRYGTADLDAIVAAASVVGFRPPVRLGHDDDPAALAHGVVTNLRRQGDVLLADFEQVPAATLELIRTGRLLSVSAELFVNLKRGGRIFPKALRAVALLGGHPPAVSDLRPLADVLPAGRA